jgi:hypothetical protein
MFNRIGMAFAGITAGLITTFTATTSAQGATSAHHHSADCKIVAAADRALCLDVQRQHAYGWVNDDGAQILNPNGRALVHEITHDGMSKTQMHRALKATAAEYRDHVTAVKVNMDAIVRVCGNTDGRWIISFVDEDGMPGGLKLTRKTVDCA